MQMTPVLENKRSEWIWLHRCADARYCKKDTLHCPLVSLQVVIAPSVPRNRGREKVQDTTDTQEKLNSLDRVEGERDLIADHSESLQSVWQQNPGCIHHDGQEAKSDYCQSHAPVSIEEQSCNLKDRGVKHAS